MKTHTRIFLLRNAVLLLLCALPFLATAEDRQWAGFRGPAFNGTSTGSQFGATSGGQIAVKWRAPAGPAYAGISIADGKAVTLFSDGTNDVVAAYDAKSGKELWRHTLAPVYKGYDGSHDGVIATSAISGGKVYSLHPAGKLNAVDLATGKEAWSIDVTQHGGSKPHYGYSSSPLVVGGVVVVQIGGGDTGKAVTAFDAATGKLKWTVGDDKIGYQSPLLFRAGGKDLILAAGAKKLYFIDPASGKPVFEYEHGGDDSVSVMVPVPFEKDRLLLRLKEDATDVIKVAAGADGKLAVEKVWSAPVFKNSYCIPVYHNGYLYGFNGRILTAVNAATGEVKWRSRGVEDGFLILVDGNLLVQTKAGRVYVGPASADGWKETARLDLFKDISWTPPSFADGMLFTRSHGEIASLEWRSAAGAVTSAPVLASATIPSSSEFGKFLEDVKKASDKKAAVDKFLASKKSFPLVEWPDRVIFLFRGDVQDVAIAGDLQGAQREEQMKKVEGTDLYYHIAHMEPDARIHYRFVKNYEELIADPLNTRQPTKDRRGGALSWMAMPGWSEPQYLQDAPAAKKGTLETHELKSTKREGASVKLEVYLPAGYAAGSDKYPVVYIHDQGFGRSLGLLHNAFDNLNGVSIRPVIAVFMPEVKTAAEPIRDSAEQFKAVTFLITEEVVPFIDSKYRTLTDARSRALAGGLEMGTESLITALANPQMFGSVVVHSAWIDGDAETALKNAVRNPGDQPVRIYMDWGLYDARSATDGWDLRRENKKLYALLQERGFRPAGGETRESYGWASWRNRAANWLITMFPLSNS